MGVGFRDLGLRVWEGLRHVLKVWCSWSRVQGLGV